MLPMHPHSETEAPAKAIASLADIQKIAAQIVTHFCPQKVILFGSYAYGSPTEDSDVDLLVIMETEEQPLYTAAHIAAAVDHPFPLDIVVYTPSKFEASLNRRGVFATEVLRKGVILHEA
jgi:predicted nucleotidyltransferase